MTGSPGSFDPAAASHRALRAIQQELDRHPIVSSVRGFPAGEFTQIQADLEIQRWGIERSNATVTVRWFEGDSPEALPEFSFHYSDGETDFGWHHHEQEHVEGLGHFQEYAGDSGYLYEAYEFPTMNPPHLTWEIMSLLGSRLQTD